MKLFLDDVREAPEGWTRVVTFAQAITALSYHTVTEASLDHDLGWCGQCATDSTCQCRCHFTGYDVICWMEENNVWPINGVRVHSSNPVGRKRMQVVIDRHYNPYHGQ